MSGIGLFVALASYVAAGAVIVRTLPAVVDAQNVIEISGRWSVERAPEGNDFRSPALGPDITIEHIGQKITVEYSMNRKRTWTLDGIEYKTAVRVADAGTYDEIGRAHIDKGRIVLVTGRDRGGRIAREERTLSLRGDKLIVEGTSSLDGKLIRTSSLTYQRSTPSKKLNLP